MQNNDESEITLDTIETETHNGDVEIEEDLSAETYSAQAEGMRAEDALKKMREKLRKCEDEKKEYLDGWQRMRADFANLRKEEESRRGDLVKFASEGLVEEMLPVLDSFSMAFGNKEAWEKVDANWRKGVEYIHAQMFSVLESRGLAEIGKVSEKVDPRTHVAIEEIPASSEKEAGTVSEVVQKGYRLHSKVIRPAKVKAFGHLEK